MSYLNFKRTFFAGCVDGIGTALSQLYRTLDAQQHGLAQRLATREISDFGGDVVPLSVKSD